MTANGVLLTFKCGTPTKLMRKRLLKIYSRDFPKSANFVMETLTNFLSSYGKVIIHMSTWMDGIHLVKLHYQKKKKEFYSNLTRSSSQKITTNMPKESVKTLDHKI